MLERRVPMHRIGLEGLSLIILATFIAFSVGVRGALNLPSFPPQDGYGVVEAFPGLRFDQPIAIRTPPGETNRLFVVEKAGRIMVITNLAEPTLSVFLDLRESVAAPDLESGLLGMAFHPGFTTNRHFYLYRTAYLQPEGKVHGFYDYLARFEVSGSDPNIALKESETPIFWQLDAEPQHNAGDVAFGPDGYLYLSIGDNGPVGDDISSNLQPIDKGLFGCIIRLDVDKRPENLLPNPHPSATENYYIPNDNPFVGISSYQGLDVNPAKVRTEIYANGFRNPWRFGFHPESGALLVGDVGNASVEEVDLVVKGGNYGWPYYEAELARTELASAPEGLETINPVVSYWHGNNTNQGNCVIGGVFYFGQKIPALRGQYIFGDFRRGHIWSLSNDGVSFGSEPVRLTGTEFISSFGTDPRDGEVLISNVADGKILKLVYSDASLSTFPKEISETGAFADLATLTPSDQLNAFEINQPFWSDGAIKRRWFAGSPSGEKIRFADDGSGIFPGGSVWVKHFELEMDLGDPLSRRRLETRFLVVTNGGLYGVTYRWNEAGTSARLVQEAGEDTELLIREGGITRTQVWHFPSRAECRACHTDAGGVVLGFTVSQLNKTIPIGEAVENQLEVLLRSAHIELAETNYHELPAMVRQDDASQPLRARAKSYLSANCSSCHYGPNFNATWDARFLSSITSLNAGNTLDPDNPNRILGRLKDTSISQMPPIARMVVDTNGVELMRAWIESLPKKPWLARDIGGGSTEGSSSIEPSRIVVSGSGSGFGAESPDQLHFLSLQITNNLTVSARISQQSDLVNGAAGLMIRGVDDGDAAFGFIGRDSRGALFIAHRSNSGEPVRRLPLAQSDSGDWLRIRKSGDTVEYWTSPNGSEWNLAGLHQIGISGSAAVGMASYSGNTNLINDASFTEFRLVSIDVVSPIEGEIFAAGEKIHVEAASFLYPADLGARVKFFAGGRLIGLSGPGKSDFVWTNALVGVHEIAAEVMDASGQVSGSISKAIEIVSPRANAAIFANDEGPLGSWTNLLGREGYLIPGVVTNFLPSVTVAAPEAGVYTFENPTTDPRGVEVPSGAAIACAWVAPELRFRFALLDGLPRELNLYFVDWNGANVSQQVVIRSVTDGATLASQVISNFSGGLRLSAQVRGEIEVIISVLSGEVAILNAIFLDASSVVAPLVRLIDPHSGFVGVAGEPFPLEAMIDAPVANLKIGFFANDEFLGEVSGPPYRLIVSNMLAGDYLIYAQVRDDFGHSRETSRVLTRIALPSASAAFLGMDDHTQGDWIDQYGKSGYQGPGLGTNLPSFARIESPFAVSIVSEYPPLSEKRALITPDRSDRVVGLFFDYDVLTNKVIFKDGRPHKLSIYFLDWSYAGWQSKIRIKDGEGRVLDERMAENFSGGRYMTWTIKGEVTIELVESIWWPVLSGIFIDDPPATDFSVRLEEPSESGVFKFGNEILLSAQVDMHSSSEVRQVDFMVSGRNVGSSFAPPYGIRFAPKLGEHVVQARAISASGSMAESVPRSIRVEPVSAEPMAKLVGIDEVTQGNWRTVYGSIGHWVALVSTNLPPNVGLGSTNESPYVWDWAPTDPRALLGEFGPWRTASTVFSDDSFEIALLSEDSRWRKISFYCVDWDVGTRAQKIEFRSGTDGRILSEVTLENYGGGKYVSFLARGNVVARFQSIVSHALLSGIFFDPVNHLEQWRLDHFAALGEDNWAMAVDHADPDADGIPNILEFKFGLDPNAPNSPILLNGILSNGKFHLRMETNPYAEAVEVRFEMSRDLENWSPAGDSMEMRSRELGQTVDEIEWEVEGSEVVFLRLRRMDGT